MNVNFEAIEKAWFKPKKTALDELEEWINNVKIFDDICAYEDYSGRFGIQPKYILDKIQELKKGE